jgi:hypothetical protein
MRVAAPAAGPNPSSPPLEHRRRPVVTGFQTESRTEPIHVSISREVRSLRQFDNVVECRQRLCAQTGTQCQVGQLKLAFNLSRLVTSVVCDARRLSKQRECFVTLALGSKQPRLGDQHLKEWERMNTPALSMLLNLNRLKHSAASIVIATNQFQVRLRFFQRHPALPTPRREALRGNNR